MRYDRLTRILHWGIAIGVTLQLVSEQLMVRRMVNKDPDFLQVSMLIMHEYMGFVVLIIIGIRFTLMLDSPDRESPDMFPWLSQRGRQELMAETRNEAPGWLHGQLKRPEEAHCIARSVHGLGLILALGQGLSGMLLFVGTQADGSTHGPIEAGRQLHDVLGYIMWAYIIGHVCMALFHQRLGHRVLQGMFRLKDRE
ncbi:MAG: cytochrome b/b6 domain-containing protein [Mariprofundaceae bacterium]